MSLSPITCELLKYRLGDTSVESLLQLYFMEPSFYLIAASETSPADWKAQRYGAYVSGKTLDLFLCRDAAENQAQSVKSVLPDGTPMVREVSRDTLLKLVSSYMVEDVIEKVRLQASPPISAVCSVRDVLSFPMAGNSPRSTQTVTEVGDALVQQVRSVLEEVNAQERRKVDPSGYYTNLHCLVQFLIQKNRLDMVQLDQELGLPDGFTKNFCRSIKNDETPLEIVKKYLTYFDLLPYLYLFKSDCRELKDLLKEDRQIDTRVVKKAGVHTVEPFILERLRNGTSSSGYRVFQAIFQSKHHKVELILSTNHNLFVGQKYELEGYAFKESEDEAAEGSIEANMTKIPSGKAADELLEELKKKSQKRNRTIIA